MKCFCNNWNLTSSLEAKLKSIIYVKYNIVLYIHHHSITYPSSFLRGKLIIVKQI